MVDSEKRTTIKVKGKHLDMMNVTGKILYDCEEVNRMTVLEQLIDDHPLVPSWVVENNGQKVATDGGSTEQMDFDSITQD